MSNRLSRIETELQIQFTRIAQIQAELDIVTRVARSSQEGQQ